MRKEQLKRKLVVMTQLESVMKEIQERTYAEFIFYQSQDENATPEQFLKELVQIGLSIWDEIPVIQMIMNYYECNQEEAILLYRFTDAEKLLEK